MNEPKKPADLPSDQTAKPGSTDTATNGVPDAIADATPTGTPKSDRVDTEAAAKP